MRLFVVVDELVIDPTERREAGTRRQLVLLIGRWPLDRSSAREELALRLYVPQGNQQWALFGPARQSAFTTFLLKGQ